MRLNLQTDYALRLLIYLAQHGGQASVDEVAGAFAISRHHLMKVAQQLIALGYVAARRGRGGGISLARAPAEINVGKIVRELEPTGTFVECFNRQTNGCVIAGVCGLQGALSLALGDFLARLDTYTLDKLVPQPGRLRAALGLPEPIEPVAAG